MLISSCSKYCHIILPYCHRFSQGDWRENVIIRLRDFLSHHTLASTSFSPSLFFLVVLPGGCVQVSIGDCNLPFPDDWWNGAPVSVFIGPLMCLDILLGEVSVQASCPFFYWVFFFMDLWEFYIYLLNTDFFVGSVHYKSLSHVSQIYSLTVLPLSFEKQKFILLI